MKVFMDQASADQAANLVSSLYRGTAERPIVRFPEECRPTSFFDVQKIFDSLIENFGQPVQGWKLYFPFKAGQRNLVAPIFNLLWSGDHITADLSRIRIWETEIVFRPHPDLPPRAEPYASEAVDPAFAPVPAIHF